MVHRHRQAVLTVHNCRRAQRYRRRVHGIRDVRSHTLTDLHVLVVPTGYSGHLCRDATAVLIDIFPVGIRNLQLAMAVAVHGHIVGVVTDLHLNGCITFI